jgi:hypothetical protein
MWTVAAIVLITAVTLLFTWPLALRMGTDVLGPGHADNLEYVWKMWWVPHAFAAGGDPFFNPSVALPDGYPMAYGELTPAHTFLYAPITAVFGEIAAYNLSILASFVLTGLFTYAFGLRLTRRLSISRDLRIAGALFASLTFTFSVYRMARVGVHLPLVDTQWLVLAFWMLDYWLEKRELWAAVVLAAAVALAGLSSWYYLFMLGLLLPVYGLAFTGRRGLRQFLTSRQTWVGMLVGSTVLAALIVPFLIPYIEVARDGEAVIPIDDVAFWSASIVDYLLPNPRHPIWGEAVQSLSWPFPGIDMPQEFMLSVGWLTLLLALVGWRRVRGNSFRAWKWTIVVAVVLSLGPFLSFGRLITPIPLPALILRELVPFADGVRAWGRFAAFATLGLSLIAGAAAALLLSSQSKSVRWAIAIGLYGLLLFGLWPGPAQLIPVGPRSADAWLAAQPGDEPVMEFPLNIALSGPAMLGTRYHGKPIVFGYGTYYPYLFRQRYPELTMFPQNPSLDRLAEWGVRYVVVHTSSLEGESFKLSDVLAQPRLTAVQRFDDAVIFELSS